MIEIEIKRLKSCTLEQAVTAWNTGFEGYYFDATMTVDHFTTRLIMEGLSPELSVVAFVEGEPAGLVLSGIREICGKKVAWNGGTGVASKFRRMGVGKALVQASLEVYEEQGVDIATLEAIQDNRKAIELYRQSGYEITDHLVYFTHEGVFARPPFPRAETEPYRSRRGLAQDVRRLPFYQAMGPWQTQWPSARDGESVIVHTADGEEIAYAVYKRTFQGDGSQTGVVLYQIGWHPNRFELDADDVIRFTLQQVFAPELSLRRTVVNLTSSHVLVTEALQEAGFRVHSEQVGMVRLMKKEEHDAAESIGSV